MPGAPIFADVQMLGSSTYQSVSGAEFSSVSGAVLLSNDAYAVVSAIKELRGVFLS